MQWFAQAPSNIALIKYMGKKDADTNLPINASLSYTLPDLLSSVSLEVHSGHKDFWEALTIPGTIEFDLSHKAQERFLEHLKRIKEFAKFEGNFIVRSNNNFPHSSGLASSASSFAALTKCAFLAISDLTNTPLVPIEIQAQVSRMGSGSSCRSFFAPWALWDDEDVRAIDIPFTNLIHQVIIINHGEKAVLSSSAHTRVRTSSLFNERAHQAEDNLKDLLNALGNKDWKSSYEICWREFHEMHQLFATSKPPFTYMEEQTFEILATLQNFWQAENDGPIITMDAGPNIHLLYRSDQKVLAQKFKQTYLVGNYDVL